MSFRGARTVLAVFAAAGVLTAGGAATPQVDGARAAAPAPIVQALPPATTTSLLASRFRGFGNGSQRSIYVGIPSLGTPANRNAATPTYALAPATNQVGFTYDPAAVGGPVDSAQLTNAASFAPASYLLPVQPLRPFTNVIAIQVRVGLNTTQAASLTNVVLTPAGGSAIAIGSFSVTGADQTWLVVDPDPGTAPALFAGGFTLTGTLTLTNGAPAFGACGEGCRIEFTTGVLPADMQAVTNLPATAIDGDPLTVSGTCTNNGTVAGSGTPPQTLPAPAPSPTCALSGLPPGATQSCAPSPPPSSLAQGAQITCTSTFTAPSAGTQLQITTTAGSAANDPIPANNTDSKSIVVAPRPPTPPPPPDTGSAKLVLKKKALTPRVRPGRPARFRITVRNTGTAAASDVVVCDQPPRRTTLVAAPGAKLDQGRPCWRIARLDPGTEARRKVVLRVDAVASPGKLRNLASIRGGPQRATAAFVVFGAPRPAPSGGVTG